MINPKSLNWGLLTILICYITLALGYVLLVPIGEAPDEPAHFLYVDTFAETQAPPPPLPRMRGGWLQNVTKSYEWHQPPFYYWLASLPLSLNRTIGLVTPFESFPPVIAERERVFAPTSEIVTEIHLVRILSILAGLGTVLTTYFLTRKIFPEEPWGGELAAGFVAFIPQFTFLHAYVTNDTLAILMSTLTILALIHVAVSTPESQRKLWAVAGLVLSVALIAKLTTWYLIGVGILLAVVMILTRRTSLRQGVAHFALFLLLAMGGLFVNWLLWPDLPQRLFNFQAGGINPQHLRFEYWLQLIPMTHSSFWGRFGWMNLPIPLALQVALDLIATVGLVAFAVNFYRQFGLWSIGRKTAIFVLFSAFVLNGLSFVFFNLTVRQPQGRFFFPALSVLALFTAIGWLRIGHSSRFLTVILILAIMAGINVFSLVGIVLPTYVR